jgi:hypothetical protein
MEYKNYLIEQDKTGYAPKNEQFSVFADDGELHIGSCGSIEECKKLIDKL